MRRIAPLLCTVVACLLAAPVAGAAPRATDFELSLGTVGPTARAAAADRPWTSPVLRPGRGFSVFGLRWARAAQEPRVEVRVRDADGWKRWVEAATADADGLGTDPVWAGRANAVQIRLSRRVRGLKLEFVAVTGRASRARPVARAAASQPAITPRSAWGGDTECAPRDTPTMGTVQTAFVHHTVSANEYGPADSAAMVLGICRFHRNSNGWDDVGYNFLVDKYGQIFEGRAGGVDQPVVGAQAQGWNAQSTGIANLGTYSDVPQSSQAIDAMANLVAWKLPLHGAPVTGSVTLESAGGETNRYPSGSLQTFQRISAHRDGNETECPGARLFAQLPSLRAIAERRAPAVIGAPGGSLGANSKLSLSANRLAFSFPEPARLTGRLIDAGGTGIAGQRVRIQVLTARGFRAVSSTTTTPDGSYTAELPMSRNRVVRALVGTVASNRVTLKVAPALQVTAPAKRVKAGRSSVIKGSLRPKKGLLVVTAFREVRGSYRRAFALRVRAARDGRFRAVVPLARPGLYRLRLRFAGDKRNAPAQADSFVRAVRRLSDAAPAVPAAR